MIEGMPRKLPLNVCRERNRHGTVVFYYRTGKGKRVRLPSIDSDGFRDAYIACLAASGTPDAALHVPKPASLSGSLEWLWDRYRDSGAWAALKPATQRQRINIMTGVLKLAGAERASAICEAHILKGRERRSATPAQARNFLDCMRGLFRWATEAGLVETDPTANVRNPPRKRSEGFRPWNAEDVARYLAHWQPGTPQRVWLMVALHTGLRRGDLVKVGKQHVRNGVIAMRTEKTGMEAFIAIRPELQEALDHGPIGDLHLIVGSTGRPLTKESFGNELSKAARSAGIAKSVHGLRKLAATMDAESGYTESELEAKYGWSGGAMASLYTRSARRMKLAVGAEARSQRQRTPAPPFAGAGITGKK